MKLTERLKIGLATKYLKIISAVFCLVGWSLLFYSNWMLGLGFFLVTWGQNITKILEMGVYNDIINKIVYRLDSLLGDKEVNDISGNYNSDNNGKVNNN